MADIIRLRGRPHDEVQRLLAWYVNGTLPPQEIALVEAHLAECAECRAELESERALAREVKDMPFQHADGWAALEAKLATEPPPAFDAVPDFGRKPVPFLKRRVPMGWAVASPLAAASVAALAVAALPGRGPAPETYVALGSAPANRPGNLLVMLKPDTTEQQMRALLARAGARLVDGPTATGGYVLHVSPGGREAAIRTLRAAPEVALAQPIDPGPQP